MAWELLKSLLKSLFDFVIKPKWTVSYLIFVLLSSYTIGIYYSQFHDVIIYSTSIQALGVFIALLFSLLCPGELRARLFGKLAKYIDGSESILDSFFKMVGYGLIFSGILIQITLMINQMKVFVFVGSALILILACINLWFYDC